jgi:hypothetical protein
VSFPGVTEPARRRDHLKSSGRLQIRILFVWQRHGRSFGHLLVVLVKLCLVDLDFGRSKSGRSDEIELRIADEFSGQPEEGLLKIVVGLGRNVVVLQVLLAMEGDGLRLDLALLDVDLVAAEDDGNVFADTDKVTCEILSVQLSRCGAGLRTYGASSGRSCR